MEMARSPVPVAISRIEAGEKGRQESDSFPAPYFVDTQRERMVQLIVCTGDGVKHAPDLCRFVLLVVVG